MGKNIFKIKKLIEILIEIDDLRQEHIFKNRHKY